MPLTRDVSERLGAEDAILELLREGGPLRMHAILQRMYNLGIDTGTVRRAVLRLANSGRAAVDDDFNVSLAR